MTEVENWERSLVSRLGTGNGTELKWIDSTVVHPNFVVYVGAGGASSRSGVTDHLAAVHLFANGVQHSEFHPKRLVTGSVWDLLWLPALLISLISGYRSFPPSILGKLTTVAQAGTLLAALGAETAFLSWTAPLKQPCIYAAAVMTLISGLHYTMAFRLSREAPTSEASKSATASDSATHSPE